MMDTDANRQPKSAAPSTFTPGRGLLLQRKCACGGGAGTSGECEACRDKKRLQAKLAIGASNDPLERKPTGSPIRCWQRRRMPRLAVYRRVSSASPGNRSAKRLPPPPAWISPSRAQAGRWSQRCGRTWNGASATIFPGCGCMRMRRPNNRRGMSAHMHTRWDTTSCLAQAGLHLG